MDRFIVPNGLVDTILQAYLKSSMDRFIALVCYAIRKLYDYLKSSMDRFIGTDFINKN